ncbi:MULTISPECIES: hypothetical protein [Bacillus]|uniref:hypothetical protein n=1 Tax=Bacillus TaxID=1386 RepID=UPI0003961415|nr:MULTISPECIES: hypothetical protein [Bacillus amyloliquefaciens group]ERH54825.1 hypothetical protein O205_21735 [Bacillus amyloliquefaciens EGD-AQ14]POI14552.1 hypothetical protein C2145_20700 [Bacillus velezensis]
MAAIKNILVVRLFRANFGQKGTDLLLIAYMRPEKMFLNAKKAFSHEKKPIFLGGDVRLFKDIEYLK